MTPHASPPNVPAVRHRVAASGHGRQTADYAHSRFPNVPVERWLALLDHGRIAWDDGTPVTRAHRLQEGRTLLISFPEEMLARAGVGPFPADLDVVHHDDDLIAVHKPPGLLAYPQGLATLSAKQYAERWVTHRDGGTPKLRPLHRLDRETSGVLMYAKTAEADRRIKRAFKARTVRKTYLAIVRGEVSADLTLIDAPVGPANADIRVQQAVRADGKAARTALRILSVGHHHTLVSLTPSTGRTHQIRVHLAHVGHPIVGDKLYTDGGRYFPAHRLEALTAQALDVLGMERHALHAYEVTVAANDGAVTIRAPLPEDMQRFAREHGLRWS